MKNIGIVRNIDDLGRIVLPIELRKQYDIKPKDLLEIFIDDDSIIIQKPKEKCVICDSTENVIQIKNKLVCMDCINYIVNSQQKEVLEENKE